MRVRSLPCPTDLGSLYSIRMTDVRANAAGTSENAGTEMSQSCSCNLQNSFVAIGSTGKS